MISKNQQILQRTKAKKIAQKNRRVIKELNVSIVNPEDYDKLIERDDVKEIVFDSLLNAVRYGIDNNMKNVVLFKIKNTSSFLNLERDSWKPGLIKAIDFFADKQKFEEATQCRDLIKVINEEDI